MLTVLLLAFAGPAQASQPCCDEAASCCEEGGDCCD